MTRDFKTHKGPFALLYSYTHACIHTYMCLYRLENCEESTREMTLKLRVDVEDAQSMQTVTALSSNILWHPPLHISTPFRAVEGKTYRSDTWESLPLVSSTPYDWCFLCTNCLLPDQLHELLWALCISHSLSHLSFLFMSKPPFT